jgi:cytochrome P450
MRTVCVDVINELVDPVAEVGHCDFVTGVSNHYPIAIICAMLDAPREDWQLFSNWAADISKAFGGNVADNEPAILRSWAALDGYLGLARVELADALVVLARRMPNLRCTGLAPWKSIFEISGPTTLHIAFDTGI